MGVFSRQLSAPPKPGGASLGGPAEGPGMGEQVQQRGSALRGAHAGSQPGSQVPAGSQPHTGSSRQGEPVSSYRHHWTGLAWHPLVCREGEICSFTGQHSRYEEGTALLVYSVVSGILILCHLRNHYFPELQYGHHTIYPMKAERYHPRSSGIFRVKHPLSPTPRFSHHPLTTHSCPLPQGPSPSLQSPRIYLIWPKES